MVDTWEVYNFSNYYLSELHQLIKEDKVPQFKIDYFYNASQHEYKKKDLFGIIDHSIKLANPKRALIDLVSLTEHYLQEITVLVYKDFPQKLDSKDNKEEQVDRQQKIITMILESVDKDEIINKIIEEKVRNIFYGNPTDFFTKDKAKIGIGKFFEGNHINSIKKYKEIIARRNIYIHNNGRVDRKYLREVESTSFKLGNKLKIDKEYLRECVIVLRGFACIATKLVLENTYHAPFVDSKILRQYKTFHRLYNV